MLLSAALDYARRAWPVLPLHTWLPEGRCSCGTECSSPAKHPRLQNGLHGASTDPEVIAGWWKRWPNANIGLRTGVAFDVLDVDGPEGLAALQEVRRDRATTWGPEVQTGGGGWHLYHAPTGAGNRTRLVDHVDFRGRGGYVVAPPSVHQSGRLYAWAIEGLAGPDEALKPLPDWLRELVVPAPVHRPEGGSVTLPRSRDALDAYGQRALDAELGRVAMAPEGTRNDQLNRSAFVLGQLAAAGVLPLERVVSQLVEAASRAGLVGREVEATIASGLRNGARQPRRVTA